MSTHLTLDVFRSEFRPVPAAARPFAPPGGLTWPSTTATQIIGDTSVVLVDAPASIEDARELGNRIADAGKTLQAIVITHAHGDHFLGAPVLLERFPLAHLVASPEVAEAMHAAIEPPVLAYWSGIFGKEHVHQAQSVAAPLEKNSLLLDGITLRVVPVNQSDTTPATFVYLEELGAVIGGDTAYNRVHVNLAGLGHDERRRWIDSIRVIQELHPRIVVAGHPATGRPDDPVILQETLDYIENFDRLAADTERPEELIARVLETYSDWQNITTLYNSAYSRRP